MNKHYFPKILLGLTLLPTLVAANFSVNRMSRINECMAAFNLRIAAASYQTVQQPCPCMPCQTNPDETNVPGYAGSFTKMLQHDPVTGLLSAIGVAAYQQFLKAVSTELQADWNAIQLAPGCQRVYINPQSGFAYSLEGGDSSEFIMPVPPVIASAAAAADLIEVYLQMICRDVKFNEYGTGAGSDATSVGTLSKTNNAAMILDALPAYTGPKNGLGHVDATILFRGSSPGNRVGGYISQFLLLPLPVLFPAGCAGFVATLIGVQNLPQNIFLLDQLLPIPAGREFGVSWNDYLAIQNGLIPVQYVFADYDAVNKRYPITGRDIGGFVHVDGPYEAYYNALYVLAGYKFPISPVFPYANGSITKESGGFTMGLPDAFALVGGVCLEAFKAAWAQKYRSWRRLRPEAMAGLVHQAKTTGTNPFNLDASLFATYNGVDFLQLVRNTNALQAIYYPLQNVNTYLLSQMYPEGSPTHPSYPSGHATVGGACTTVIKAIMNDQALISSHVTPVSVDPSNPTNLLPIIGEHTMTVGGELDKLASNIAFARDFAGVHYRSDAEQAMLLGEQVAIRYLQDHARTYAESGFTGFVFSKRDGTRIQVTPTAVNVIG